MIHSFTLGLDDTGLVVQEWVRIHTATDGATIEDLLHHGIGSTDGAIVGDGGIGKSGKSSAWTSFLGETPTSTCHIHSLAGGIHMRAESFTGIGGASHIGVRSLVGNASALLRHLFQPLVWAIHCATLAAANTTAVQQVLHSQVDVHTLRLAGNLDAIAQGADGAMSPARAT